MTRLPAADAADLLERLVAHYALPDELEDALEACEHTIASRKRAQGEPAFATYEGAAESLLAKVQDPSGNARMARLLARFHRKNVIKNKERVLHFLAACSPLGRPEEEERGTFMQSEQPEAFAFEEIRESIDVLYRKTSVPETEATVLEDLPFIVLGLNTRYVSFAGGGEFEISSLLPVSVVNQLACFAELGALYREIQAFIDDGGPAPSVIRQSLQAFLSSKMRDYLATVAAMETEICRRPPRADTLFVRSLKQCYYWMIDSMLLLRLVHAIVSQVEGKHGGEIISEMHRMGKTGDPFVASFLQEVLQTISRPFFISLQEWVYQGRLQDAYGEFYISSAREAGPAFAWEEEYTWSEALLPDFISKDLAAEIFLLGKSLIFLRVSCDREHWVTEYSKSFRKELSYETLPELEHDLKRMSHTTSAYVRELIVQNFHLMDHLVALKKYMMLGQGDFSAMLLETIGPSLNKPASMLLRHNLASALDSVVRYSNAQYEPEHVIRSLDARMLELAHGDLGWDVFTLEYRVAAPLDVIFTDYCNRQYLKIFNFLWRLKRVENALAVAWRRAVPGARFSCPEAIDKMWEISRVLVHDMNHFLCQLQYYILFEVIEGSWEQLILAIHRTDSTLDTIISAHRDYVRNITMKGLLGASRKSEISLLNQLHEIVKIMLAVSETVELLDHETGDAIRRQRQGAEIMPPGTRIDVIGKSLRKAKADFDARVSVLLSNLNHQSDTEMRFLAVRLNMNDYYMPPSRRRKHAKEGD